jgi:hypothetical protein
VKALACVAALYCASCASTPAKAPETSATAANSAAPQTPLTPQATEPASGRASVDARDLPPHATFADVVDAARALDDSGQTAADEPRCLLDLRGPARLAADVAVGARPLAPAPLVLASALNDAAGPASVFSAWGTTPGEALALVAFTTTTPAAARAPAIAAILTPEGVSVRAAHMAVRAHPEPLSIEATASLLAELEPPAIVYVSAEAAIPLERVAALLRALPERFEVALAVALPKGTRLPAPERAPSTELTCPDGLPAPRPDEPEGELDPAALRGALGPLKEQALACALSTGGRALLGGKLTLGLRVNADGKLDPLCMLQDTIGESLLRRCVIEAARALRMPAPEPRGFVDVHLPLELALLGPTAQRALCE